MRAERHMRVSAFARTDVGKVRQDNEDDFFSGEQLFAVADGMGGHAGGEVASKTALEPLAALDDATFASGEEADEALAEALHEANRRVVELAVEQPNLKGMGTTLTAALLREGRLHVAHVGDSRAYLLRPGEGITQLTTDHTLVQRLVTEGRLSRDEAATHPQRNVITRAIGNEAAVVVDSLPPIRLQPGDQVLLCSDGLTGPLNDADLAEVLESSSGGDEAVQLLIAQANEAGGPDNITLVLLRVGEAGDNGARRRAPRQKDVRRIRTSNDGDADDWAKRLGRFGAQQGVETRPDRIGATEGSGRGKRVMATLLGLVLLLGIIGGGAYMLLSRAYFVGAHEGQVAIFRGVPEQVGNVPLNRVIDDEVTSLELSDFPEWQREQIEDGITARSVTEARNYLINLERNLDGDAPPGDDGT